MKRTTIITAFLGFMLCAAPVVYGASQAFNGTATNLAGTPGLPNGTTATTQTAGSNDTKIATNAYVDSGLALKAPLANPTFTGTVTTPVVQTSVSSTAFVGAGASTTIFTLPAAPGIYLALAYSPDWIAKTAMALVISVNNAWGVNNLLSDVIQWSVSGSNLQITNSGSSYAGSSVLLRLK